MEKMREEFETWAKNEGYYIDTIDDYLTAELDGLPAGSYRSYEVRVSWEAWKASRAALCIQLPKPMECDGAMILMFDVEEVLEDAGIQHK